MWLNQDSDSGLAESKTQGFNYIIFIFNSRESFWLEHGLRLRERI